MCSQSCHRKRYGVSRVLASNKFEHGFSLVELMIAMAVGLFVMGGVVSIFGVSAQAQSESIQTARLQQELRATVSIIRTDIRRAGYWGDALANLGANNPFTTATTDINVLNGGDCILYTYDLNHDGNVDNNNEYFGFRLNNNAVEMRTSGITTDDCSINAEWEAVTDSNIVTVTTLNFDTSNYNCSNITNPADTNCTAPTIGDVTQTIRQLNFTLAGNLSKSPMVARTFDDTIRVRNDLLILN